MAVRPLSRRRLPCWTPRPRWTSRQPNLLTDTSVTFSWQNFRQSSFAETVIKRMDGREIYHGAGTNFVWRSDGAGDQTFQFFSRDKAGRLSRPEVSTVLPGQ